MRRHGFLAIAATILSLAACTVSGGTLVGTSGTGTTKTASVDQDFDLIVGQSARVDGTTIMIAFSGITEDSRCPIGVQCIWAGNAAAAVSVTDGTAGKTDISLNTTLTPRSVRASGYEITLVTVDPYPKQGVAIPPATYVARFRVARL